MEAVVSSSELAQARAELYHLLAGLYSASPRVECLKSLAKWVSLQPYAESESQWPSEEMESGLLTLDNFFKSNSDKSWNELEETVSVEFTRLLRGVRQHYSPPPPYESVYREEGGRVFGELSMQVQSCYRRFSLDLTSEFRGEPPDHLSFELEFMYYLCRRESEAWEGGDEDKALCFLSEEKEFLEEHILAWFPAFCAKVREFDHIGFFLGVATLTEGWLNIDYQEHM